MDISKIQSFIMVANTGNATEAADELFISQSTVSKHIIGLEKELGIKLFYRKGKTFSLTPEGKTILRYYSEMMAIFDKANIAIEEMKNKVEGSNQIRIMGGSRMSHYGIVCSLTSFMQENPDITIRIDDAGTRNIQYALASGDCELAFCLDTLLDINYYSWQFFFRDEYAAYVCVDSPYRDKDIIFPNDLEKIKIIAGSTESEVLQHRAKSINKKLNVVFETEDPAIAIEYLLINPDHIYVAPKIVLNRYPGALTKQVQVKGLGDCAWVIAWKRKTTLSQCAKDYLKYMRKYPPEKFIEESLERKVSMSANRIIPTIRKG